MGNALDQLTGGPAAHTNHLRAQLLLAADPARCAICGASLGDDEDEAATAAFLASWTAAYATPAQPASRYTPGTRVYLWDSGCLAVVVDSAHLIDGQIQVDDLHVEADGRRYVGMIYPASQLRPATEAA